MHSSVLVWTIAIAAWTVGCGDGNSSTVEMPSSSSSGGGGGGGGNGMGGEGGAPVPTECKIDACVLDGADPFGACTIGGSLTYSSVMPGAEVTRTARVDNKCAVDTTILTAKTEDLGADLQAAFVIEAVRYEPDPITPGVFQRIVQPLPAKVSPGDALFFELKLKAPFLPGPLPDGRLVVDMLVDGKAVPQAQIPIAGSISECPMGTGDCDGLSQSVCETNLMTTTDHCGACGNACVLPNATPSCSGGACAVNACDAGYADCDNIAANGCEITLADDPDHCGACGTSCNGAFPNSVPTCAANQCVLTCMAGFVDANGQAADGCECKFENVLDLPDDNFVDSNCDGIDGTESEAIFVAQSGSNLNAGTKAKPLASISKGIQLALATGKTQVYVSEGIYNGRITLKSGISVYGGYSEVNEWERAASYKVSIESTAVQDGRIAAVEGYDLTTKTTLDRVVIKAGSATLSDIGVSSYAMYCRNCGGFSLRNSDLTAGNGGPGKAGVPGVNGAAGSAGGNGGSGSCSANPGGAGGIGGSSVCGSGGSGGKGGDATQAGDAGASGAGGTLGGVGGTAGNPGNPGQNGSKGANGTDYNNASGNGAGGVGGGLVGFYWMGNGGLAGLNGTHGKGGGGGGGGGGEKFTLNNGGGNGGGAGGSPGCGATGGTGGLAGGGSFGVFVVATTGAIIENSIIRSGNGGSGGAGAIGGIGGAGGNGGLGNSVCTVDVGQGGNGGAGGNGGHGGHGGGGPGGDSYAIYRGPGTTIIQSVNTLLFGSGGNGGSSPGNAGATGAAGPLF